MKKQLDRAASALDAAIVAVEKEIDRTVDYREKSRQEVQDAQAAVAQADVELASLGQRQEDLATARKHV
jgi:chromosome segregation ATPase